MKGSSRGINCQGRSRELSESQWMSGDFKILQGCQGKARMVKGSYVDLSGVKFATGHCADKFRSCIFCLISKQLYLLCFRTFFKCGLFPYIEKIYIYIGAGGHFSKIFSGKEVNNRYVKFRIKN